MQAANERNNRNDKNKEHSINLDREQEEKDGETPTDEEKSPENTDDDGEPYSCVGVKKVDSDHDLPETVVNSTTRTSVTVHPTNKTKSLQEGPSGDDSVMNVEALHIPSSTPNEESPPGFLKTLGHAFKQTIVSPGFMAMTAGFITACIPPLQKALFEGGGPLRFIGSAMETVGTAASPISTMVVAASLVPPPKMVVAASLVPPPKMVVERKEDEDEDRTAIRNHSNPEGVEVIDENPCMTDPNFGPYRRRPSSTRLQGVRTSLRRVSEGMQKVIPRSSQEMVRLHLWFCASRLFLTPAIVVGLILALDCSGDGFLGNVPNLAKLVIIVNSSLPGALIVIVLLKCDERMAETASVVAKVYMPSYFLSIFTIGAWSAVGLWITLPDEDGLTYCMR